MTQENTPQPTLETSPSLLSASSKKKRHAALVLQECIKHGLPKPLRARAEKAVATFSKNLRYLNQPHAPFALTQAEQEAVRAEKVEGLKTLEDCLEASLPEPLKHRVSQSVRDITGNLEYSPGGAGHQVRQEALDAMQSMAAGPLSPALQRLVGNKIAQLKDLGDDELPPNAAPPSSGAGRSPKP